ncbi:MAG: hypothetical protein ACJ8FS_09465, partial [Sphingomicrobium sp.]
IAAAIKDKKPLTFAAMTIGLAFVLFAFYGSGLESFLLSLGLLLIGAVMFLIRKPFTSPPGVSPGAGPDLSRGARA